MVEERKFIREISVPWHRDPLSAIRNRLVYADWLEERGDLRAGYLRWLLAVSVLPPDHPSRLRIETQLSEIRMQIDAAWVKKIDQVESATATERTRTCGCFKGWRDGQIKSDIQFHRETQDTECDEWKRLHDLIDEAIDQKVTEFSPLKDFDVSQRLKIRTLPDSIADLKHVKKFVLYGTFLNRIPRAIEGMESLTEFHPYTSYLLHWYPFEITRCNNLRDSTVSTRALYGNFKFRPPFPVLQPWQKFFAGETGLADQMAEFWQLDSTRVCSVCRKEFEDREEFRFWLSLGVGTDVLPLLVNACSQTCVDLLPRPTDDFFAGPHRGGTQLAR